MRVACLLAGTLLLATVAAPADAWTAGPDRPHHALLAEEAAARLPPAYTDLLARHAERFRAGALDPDGVTDPNLDVPVFYHVYDVETREGGGIHMALQALRDGARAMRENESDGAYLLGVASHIVTDLAIPLHTSFDRLHADAHEPFERAAYDHRDELRSAPAREPRVVDNPGLYLENVSRRAASLAPAMEAALAEAGEARWSPALANVTSEAVALAVESTADLLFTALVRSADANDTLAAFDPEPWQPGLNDRVEEATAANPVLVMAAAAVAAFAVGAGFVWHTHRRRHR